MPAEASLLPQTVYQHCVKRMSGLVAFWAPLIDGASKTETDCMNAPAHDINYIKTCVTSEDADQPVHLHSLIRVFANRMCFYSLRAIRKGLNYNPCHTWWMYRLIWVFDSHRGLIVGFVVPCLWQNSIHLWSVCVLALDRHWVRCFVYHSISDPIYFVVIFHWWARGCLCNRGV